MGTPSYATKILNSISQDKKYEIVAIFTQPDKPVGRKKTLTPPNVKLWQMENAPKIKLYQPNRLRDSENIEILQRLKPDFIIVAAYGQILPKEILNIAPCINLHASLLPKYRGASPIQSAILNDEKYSGITAMLMDEGLDTGKILGFKYLKIQDNNSLELFEKLSNIASFLILKILNEYENIEPLDQIHALSSYAPKIKKEDGLIFLSWSAKKIYSHFKALTPWPGIFFENGLKILECELVNDEKEYEVLGQILNIDEDSITITTKKGSLKIKSVQMPSKNAMQVTEFLKGFRRSVGDTLF